jgi:hypothetical protein
VGQEKRSHVLLRREHIPENLRLRGGPSLDARRQYKRILLKGDEIRVEIMTETSAQVTDLSKLGIGVKASMRLRPGSPCTVTIGSNGSLVVLQGTLLWERFGGWSANPRGQVDTLFFAGIRLDDERHDLMIRACGGECDSARTVRVKASGMTARLSYAESLAAINLSYKGLLAESLNTMESGTERIARLFLPDSPEPIKCITRVTSCKPVKYGSEKKYHIGFEFVTMDEAQAERLKTFILLLSAI